MTNTPVALTHIPVVVTQDYERIDGRYAYVTSAKELFGFCPVEACSKKWGL